MGFTSYIVMSQRRVDMTDLSVLLATRGPLPGSDDPEDFWDEEDGRGRIARLIQPIRGGQITVTLDTHGEWKDWPAEWQRVAAAKLGKPIRARINCAYRNRAELAGTDPQPIMDELLATGEAVNHQVFVWLRIIGEHWGWPAAFCIQRVTDGAFVALTAQET
jgi:hypothetical protein